MARIRTVKPEFWEDEKIASLSRDARLLFIGLWNHADDSGRMRAHPRFVQSKVFPYDLDLDVRPLIRELASNGFLCLYSSDGQDYLWVRNFSKHQRIDKPQKSLLPEPPAECSSYSEMYFGDNSTNDPRTFPVGMEGNGSGNGIGRGEGRASANASLPPSELTSADVGFTQPPSESNAFAVFMDTYPIKTGRDPANREFKKRYRTLEDQSTAVSAVKAQVEAGMPLKQEAVWWIREGRERDPIVHTDVTTVQRSGYGREPTPTDKAAVERIRRLNGDKPP